MKTVSFRSATIFTSFVLSALLITSTVAKQSPPFQKIVIQCEGKFSINSYADNNSYIKDTPLHSQDLYTERFTLEIQLPSKATKTTDVGSMIVEEYAVNKQNTIYRLNSIKKSGDQTIVVDFSNFKYSSVEDKHDALMRIKSTGTCVKE